MDFTELCMERFKVNNSVLCVGLDPELEKIPVKAGNIEKKISGFYITLLDSFNKYMLAVKPNIAFYEQYGIDGYNALKKIINHAKKLQIPVILDAKRGDIGNTSIAYAKAAFKELNADALTLSPYLGEDSLAPFFDYKDKGFFILNRTSNTGSSDIQLLKLENNGFVYEEIARKIILWNSKYNNNIGGVIGATHTDELKNLIRMYSEKNYPPILIPGVGKQGGNFNNVIEILKLNNYPLHKIFINSSSKINYAYLDYPGMDYLDASLIEIKKMMIY